MFSFGIRNTNVFCFLFFSGRFICFVPVPLHWNAQIHFYGGDQENRHTLLHLWTKTWQSCPWNSCGWCGDSTRKVSSLFWCWLWKRVGVLMLGYFVSAWTFSWSQLLLVKELWALSASTSSMTPKDWTWTRCNGSLTRCATCTSTGPELWLFLLLVNMPTNLHFWLEWQLEAHPTQHFNTTFTTSKPIIWDLDFA